MCVLRAGLARFRLESRDAHATFALSLPARLAPNATQCEVVWAHGRCSLCLCAYVHAVLASWRGVARTRTHTTHIQYTGPHHHHGTALVGVALDEPHGQHNGTYKGHRYFVCRPVFTHLKMITSCGVGFSKRRQQSRVEIVLRSAAEGAGSNTTPSTLTHLAEKCAPHLNAECAPHLNAALTELPIAEKCLLQKISSQVLSQHVLAKKRLEFGIKNGKPPF